MKKLIFLLLCCSTAFADNLVFRQGDRLQAGNITATTTTTPCPGTLTVASCVTADSSGMSTVFVTVTGTFTETLNFTSSVDGVTFTSISGAPLGSTGGAVTSSITTTGSWAIIPNGAQFIKVSSSSFTSGIASVAIVSSPTTYPGLQGNRIDPCQTDAILKTSIAINISAAGTTQLVALSGVTSIYVCSYVLSTTGATTATAVQFTSGTGTNCAASPTVLTGTEAQSLSTSAVVVAMGGGSTVLKAPSGNALCITVAGGTPNVQGHLAFVQQ